MSSPRMKRVDLLLRSDDVLEKLSAACSVEQCRCMKVARMCGVSFGLDDWRSSRSSVLRDRLMAASRRYVARQMSDSEFESVLREVAA